MSRLENIRLGWFFSNEGSSFEFMAGNKLVLETEDTVTVVSDTTNSVDVALTIMEQT